jgi:murein DD-endopeptidase MepM/ murein hydrolase activator NlpD
VIATAAPKSTSDIKQPAIQDKALKAVDPSQYSQIQRQTFTVSRGDSLTSLFLKAGMTASDVINVINSNTHTAKADNAFTHLALGDSISFLIVDGALLELKRATSTNHVFTALKALGTKNTYLISQVEPQPISGATNKFSVEAAIHQTSTPADNWVYYTVQADDNLSTLFFRAGLSATDVHYVRNVAKKDATFNRMLPNEKVAFLIRDSHLIKMKYIINQFKSVVFTRLDKANYQIEVLERKPVISQKKFAGSITNSLFVDALNAGLSSNMVMNFAKIFAWDIDFSQDIQPGDEFKLVYEEKTIDGSKFENGNIIAAQFTTGGQDLIGIFYRDSMGDGGFYTPEGRSMRKAFLRMPVELARISSKFNPRRLHPISKTVRPHRGVDYAAKSGTPIMASGNGKIVHLGRKGNYGKTIVIQHGTSINTLYAHMSGYYKDLKVGSRVPQGQVIGYIGATGAVTGPHLHYEFRVDGVHKNPLTVKLPKAISLDPTEKKAFSIVAQAALKQLNFAPSDPSIPEKLAINGINTAHEKP